MCNQNNPLQMLATLALTFASGMVVAKVLDAYIDWSAQRIANR
ncbi:hypothetical protein [Amphibiibacter pelophylacis]|uniref:Uncharacterized protein n=1 Tax=Amphibiibacter pelophylacis TaxID=1799477 RepID=A0ACC6P4V3_9BURK